MNIIQVLLKLIAIYKYLFAGLAAMCLGAVIGYILQGKYSLANEIYLTLIKSIILCAISLYFSKILNIYFGESGESK